ncbi:hypothetical protein ACFUMH_16060 [Cellulomonas sp. NPDC057328]|uniref:hypothetical protein n=1 Tax=Cellulomonas sp. NPDC057328 TaxID=3346101 RepID=UPI00362B27B9
MSETGVEWDADDLRADATDHWDPWSDRLRGYGEAATAAYAPVTTQDWSLIPGAQDVRVAFETFLGQVTGFLGEGAEVMEGIARTLLGTAADYVEAEEGSTAELAEIQAELEGL